MRGDYGAAARLCQPEDEEGDNDDDRDDDGDQASDPADDECRCPRALPARRLAHLPLERSVVLAAGLGHPRILVPWGHDECQALVVSETDGGATVRTVGATVELRDGRALGYEEWGPADGYPVLGFLGTPLSLRANLGEEAPRAAEVRLVLVDRPGYGASDHDPLRTLLDWPRDVSRLADVLEVDRFAVFGMSGGGPHAAACAYSLADRVSALALVSSPGPVWDRRELRYSLPVHRQPLIEVAADDPDAAARMLLDDCRRQLARFAAGEEAEDDTTDPQLRERLRAGALASTPEGYARDLFLLFVSPWGFRPEQISVPTTIWHGDRDPAVPFAIAEFYAGAIRASTLHRLPGEGHLVLWPHAAEILAALRPR
jgi:pimeloyl-ACP methyl ester carboxylesterase